MESKDLYRHLLGLTEPWTVQRVDLDTVKMHVEVHAGHAPQTRFACPQCGLDLAVWTWRSTTTVLSGCGATWTAVSS